MSSFKMKGFDKLEKQLKQMKKGAKELKQTKNVPLETLFTLSFMRKYTSYSSIYTFIEAGGFSVKSQKDFEAIPQDDLDKYVSSNTKFNTWQNMLDEATSQYAIKKLVF